MQLDPADLSAPDRYKLLIGCVVPRPIAWVSSVSPDGRHNLAPFSFFAGVAAVPMTLVFCPANNADGSEKDTLRNARPVGEGGTGEFVVNVASEALARRVVACAEPLPYGQSEFELAGVTPAPGVRVRAPRALESPVSFECRTLQVVRLAPGQPSGGNLVIGAVVFVHAHEGVLNDRLHADPAALGAIGRMGGQGYCTTRDRFELPMGREALRAGPLGFER